MSALSNAHARDSTHPFTSASFALTNQYMKGAELYVWKAPTGLIRYSLLPGTNRLKTKLEIEAAGKELDETIKNLTSIPKGKILTVHTSSWVGAQTDGLSFLQPSHSEWRKLKQAAKAHGLVLRKAEIVSLDGKRPKN